MLGTALQQQQQRQRQKQPLELSTGVDSRCLAEGVLCFIGSRTYYFSSGCGAAQAAAAAAAVALQQAACLAAHKDKCKHDRSSSTSAISSSQ